jgi:hypothetical protein
VHDNGDPDDGFSFKCLFAHQDYHVDVKPANVAVFIENVADVVGHMTQEVVIFGLDDGFKSPPHYHEHALLELLSAFLYGLNQVREREQPFKLIRGQAEVVFVQVNLAEHQHFDLFIVYDS